MNQDMKMKMEETGRDDKMNDWKDWERSRAMRKKRESDKVDNENSSKHFIMGIVWRSNLFSLFSIFLNHCLEAKLNI